MDLDINNRLVNFHTAMSVRHRNGVDTTAEELSAVFRGADIGGIEIFTSYTGVPVGYVSYARINRYTLDFIARSKTPILHPHEWDEGHITHVVDYMLIPGQKIIAIRRFRSWFKKQRCVSFMVNETLRIYKRKRKVMSLIYKG